MPKLAWIGWVRVYRRTTNELGGCRCNSVIGSDDGVVDFFSYYACCYAPKSPPIMSSNLCDARCSETVLQPRLQFGFWDRTHPMPRRTRPPQIKFSQTPLIIEFHSHNHDANRP